MFGVYDCSWQQQTRLKVHLPTHPAPAGARVLFDPWLVGDLQFFEQGWLYTGKKRGFGGSSGVKVDVASIAQDTDVILISQVG